MGDNNDLRFEYLDETVSFFAWRLAQPKQLIASSLFILHVLSTSWDVEMNYPQDQVATRIDECEALLVYLNDLNDS